jgi:hypothetical protein
VRAQLGEEAKLSATEIIRRAERCMALAVRKGQAEGRIRKRGQRRTDQYVCGDLPNPTDLLDCGGLKTKDGSAYSLADDVSDAQFDAAIEQAKAERNLSRANVVRKVSLRVGQPRGPLPVQTSAPPHGER